MLLCSQKKTHPCEGCRERKKKCSGDYPCIRCKRLGIECIFLQPTLPPDHAYVDLLQQQELALEVETLNSGLATMEKTLSQLRGETETTAVAVTTNDNGTPSQPTSSDASFNWQLTLGKHGITVETSINSYGDLLKQMKLWQQACQSPSIGRSPSSPSGMVILRRQLPLWLLRRGYFMAITICVKSQQMKSDDDQSLVQYNDDDADHSQQQPSPPLSDHDTMKYEDAPDRFPPMTITTFRFADSRDQICRQILDTFFACYHVRLTILHQPTFYRLFINSSPSLIDSPVVNAVCALALTVRCRHMQHLVPYQDQPHVAMVLCNRARHLVAFDEPSLDSFIVFTILAMYKQMIFSVDDASFYLDLAFRTRCLLIDDDDDDDDDNGDDQDGEKEMIKRLHWALWEVQTSLEYYNNQRGVPVSTTTATTTGRSPHHPIIKLMREKRHQYIRHALQDEPPAIHESLQMAYYRAELMLAQGSFLRRVRFDADDTIDLKYLAETEYRFTKCYHDLPSDYRLDAGLFELSDDLAFRQRLDCIPGGALRKTAALNLTLQYYQGIISLYEPFLPNLKERQRAQVLGLLNEDGDTPSMEPTTTPAATPTPADRPMDLTMHHRHAQEKCTEAATNIIRLLDYQRSLPSHCSVNMHILLTAWDIHMRNACFGLAVDGGNTLYFGCLAGDTILEARQSLLQCFSILREGYLFNFAEHAIWRYYEHVERQLLDSLPMTPPPTASYWIPYGL